MNYVNHKFDYTNLILKQLNSKAAFVFVSAIIGCHERMAIKFIKKSVIIVLLIHLYFLKMRV